MAEGEGVSGNHWRRSLLAGAILLVCVAGTLLLSLRYASSALNSWSAVSAVVAAEPFALLAVWFISVRFARLAGAPATNSASFWATSLAVVVSFITPSRLFEAVKPVVLNLTVGLPLARGFAALALERILDAGSLALLAALAVGGAAAQYVDGLRDTALALAAILALGLGILAAVAAWPSMGERMVSVLPVPSLRNIAREMLAVLAAAGSSRSLLASLCFSLFTWCAGYLSFLALLLLAGTIPLSPVQVLFVYVAGMLGLVLTVTPGGLGTYEGGIVLALSSLGCPLPDAIALSILLRIVVFLPAVAASLVFLARGSLKLGDLVARLREKRNTYGGP